MTDTQHKRIIKYLEQQGYICTPIGNKAGDIFVDVIINGKEIRLKCEFPKSFPYSFPRIYILKEFYKDFEPLPHISPNGYICTFDNNVAIPNHKEPEKLVCESLGKAVKVLKDGVNDTNREDFIEEFTSYWYNELKYNITVFALFTPDNNSQLLYCYNEDYKVFYVNDDVDQLKEWLKYSRGICINDVEIERCLYLPLRKTWYPPYPKTDKEIYLKVKEDTTENFNAYYKYLTDRTKMSLIIFSQEIRGEKYLAGWFHQPAQTPQGFRKGKIVPELAYLAQNKNREVIKVDVTQLDRRRLFNRGGDGKIISNYKVSVTGCGSIGSYLIQVLAELSLDNFVLIDKDILNSENIARHMCGASKIGKFKTDAIKDQLISHYPYIKCESISKDVFEVLDESIEIFNNCDVNFVVVGHKPTESKFIELVNRGIITKPIVIIWVEPYLLGAHAIIVQNQQDVESIIYDEEYTYKYSVLSDGKKYTKKEAGCQSTYIPYSAFEIKQFLYRFMDYFYNNHIIRKSDGNYLFSWGGNLKWARAKNFEISDFWLSKDNRTIELRRLDINEKV